MGTVAECACGWSTHSNLDEEGARFLCILHVLVRHPTVYHETTGRDPEEATRTYREALANPEVLKVL